MSSSIVFRSGARSLRSITRPSRALTSYSPRNTQPYFATFNRQLASKASSSEEQDAIPKSGLYSAFARILAPNPETGKNGILRMLGYYTVESRAIGAGRTLYDQIIERSNAAVVAEVGPTEAFMPRFELLAVHVYLTIRRLRMEKGTTFEPDCKIAMQTLSDCFWNDVRYRMMMEEGGLTLIQSSKWLKECEKIFFGIAVTLDDAWGNSEKMNACISKSISSMADDEERINKFRAYMQSEYSRLEEATISEIWEGVGWDSNYRLKNSS